MARPVRVLPVVLVAAVLLASLLYGKQRQGPLLVSGVVEAEEVRVGSRVGGRVARVSVQEGQAVTIGEALVELEPYDLDERLAQSKAQLAAAQATLARLEAGNRPEEVAQAEARRDEAAARLAELRAGARPQEVQSARAGVELAEAELELAEAEKERLSRLRAAGAIAQDDLDVGLTRWRVAGARLAAQREALGLVQEGARQEQIAQAEAALRGAEAAFNLARAGSRAEDVARARHEVEAAMAQVASLQRAKDELVVRAPLAGLVEALDLQPGDLISPNAPVITLRDPTRLWVRCYVPVTHLARVQEGGTLPVQLDGVDEQVPGKVAFVSRQAEFTPSNVQTPEDRHELVLRVKLDLPSDPRLRPGMTGDVVLGPPP